MTETICAQVYNYPKYYDLVFGSEWKTEYDFLNSCFAKHAARPVRRLFEPACGTGRLLIRFAEKGFEVCGNDSNPHAVEYCNARLKRKGLPEVAVVGDMSDFSPPRKVDVTFNMINSFRHLLHAESVENHLRRVASKVARGGLYVLGMHLIPTRGTRMKDETWFARRGGLGVVSHVWSKRLNLRRRREVLGIRFDVSTPTGEFRIEDEFVYRTYTARQMRQLLNKIPEFELAEIYDFAYDVEHPIAIEAETEDVIYVLRKR